jgi:hypothetical protein
LKYSPPVDPQRAYPIVFIFNISKARMEGRSVFEATRRSWTKNDLMFVGVEALAVGLEGGVSTGVFAIDSWSPVDDPELQGRYLFNGSSCDEHELLRKNFRSVISHTGYWQYGSYIVAEFGGEHRCRLLRGSKTQEWFELRSNVPFAK